ncbi:MAG: putative diguanylate cyclase YegE [Syntrophomonadaceae bacterium]|nr:putative diguanylate cyclase YegE [Bacillota bacterium]
MDRMEQQKEVERRHLEREHAFVSLVGKLPGIVYRCRLEQNRTMEYVSERCQELTGYRPEDLEHNRKIAYGELIHPEDRSLLWDKINAAAQASNPFTVEYRIITAEGKVKWVWEQGIAVMDHQGLVTSLEGYITDISERISMEEALRRSEEHYRDILASIEDGYYEVDLKGNYTFFNDSLLKIFGYSRDEMQNLNYRELSLEPEKVFEVFNRVYRTCIPEVGFIWKCIKRGGAEGTVEVSASVIKDMKQQPVGFRGMLRDVTDRVRLEEALRRSEARYREILASIEEGYYEVDLKGRFTYCNDAIYRWSGYTAEELLGVGFEVLVKDSRKVYDAYKSVFSAGDPERNFLLAVANKYGKEAYAEISISLIKGQQGNVTGFRGIVRDITARRRAALEIERQKNHFEALFTHSTDAIIFFDKEERIVNCNRQFTALFGYAAEEVKGKIMSALIFRGRKMQVIADFSRKILRGESIECELVANHRHGQPIEVIMKGVPVAVNGREVGGYVIFSDITDRKRHMRQLEYLSMHDSLTGVYNRAYFEEEIRRLSDGREFPVSIIVADIDNLKYINDTYGHSFGDALLKAGAMVLQASVRRRDVVARIGGDEFVLLLPKTAAKKAAEIARRITVNVENYNKENTPHQLSFSLGTATTVHADKSLMTVFKTADNEMYCNKREKKQLSREGALAQ